MPLRKAAEASKTTRPTLAAVRELLDDGGLARILAILPAAFHKSQQEAALLLRTISINCYNCYDDADAAKAIVQLGSLFSLKSPSLQTRIAEDLAALDERITEAQKDEAHILVNKQNCDITREGIRFGDSFIGVDDVQTVRWASSLSLRPLGRWISAWRRETHGTTGTVAWRATDSLEKQRELFGQLTNAAFTYLLPSLASRIRQGLSIGQRFRIGTVTISEEGIWFEKKGWFTSKPFYALGFVVPLKSET